MWQDANRTAKYFQHIQNAAQNSSIIDAKLGGMGVYMDGYGFTLSGSYFGQLQDVESKIAPEFLRSLPTPTASTVVSLAWVDFLVRLGGAGTLSTATEDYDAHDNFFAKSVSVPEESPLTDDALRSYFSYIIDEGTAAPAGWFSIIDLHGGPGSAVNDKDVGFAAYSDRSALWVAQHYTYTDVGKTLPSSSIAWVEGLNEAMTSAMPDAKFGAYLNYVDPSLSAVEAHRLYYGDSLYQRLLRVKREVDPENVFWNPQTIGA